MIDERTRRVGQNEALYRQVNERIEDLNDAFGEVSGEFAVVCECGDLYCMEQITFARTDYERTRANPNRFILRPGHEAPDVEQIVERGPGYVVVEKASPDARRHAGETDPRP